MIVVSEIHTLIMFKLTPQGNLKELKEFKLKKDSNLTKESGRYR